MTQRSMPQRHKQRLLASPDLDFCHTTNRMRASQGALVRTRTAIDRTEYTLQ